ncbi:MlaD family protein, partial [Salinivirga cyanobacteriivorans]
MEKQHKQRLKLGLLVLGGLLFFVVSVYFLGKKQNLFRSVIEVSSDFNNVKGLQIGNKIQFTGIKVGVVSDITILNDTTVRVLMSIDKDVRKFINNNSKVEIANEGLMGNKLLTIHPGTGNFPPISEGDNLSSKTSVTTDELFTQAKNIINEGKSVVKNLNEISDKLNNGEGDLAQLLN